LVSAKEPDSMRYAIVIVMGAIALTGCSGQNPVRPDPALAATSASGSERVAARASDGATQFNFSVALTVPAYPTCALTPPSAGVITGTGVLSVIIRSTTDGSGGTHVGSNIHGHGTATDAAGGSWTWGDADLNNDLFPSGNASDGHFEQTITEQFHVIGPKGQQIKVQGVFHITMVNGSTVVEIDKGNHEENEVCESG